VPGHHSIPTPPGGGNRPHRSLVHPGFRPRLGRLGRQRLPGIELGGRPPDQGAAGRAGQGVRRRHGWRTPDTGGGRPPPQRARRLDRGAGAGEEERGEDGGDAAHTTAGEKRAETLPARGPLVGGRRLSLDAGLCSKSSWVACASGACEGVRQAGAARRPELAPSAARGRGHTHTHPTSSLSFSNEKTPPLHRSTTSPPSRPSTPAAPSS